MRLPKEASLKQKISIVIYYMILQYLPTSATPVVGKFSKKMRYNCCKLIFKKCGKSVNIERKANFSNGLDIEIGDFSGIGINCIIPPNTRIGSHVLMGPNCIILNKNHLYKKRDAKIIDQGYSEIKITQIEDDCWIGRDVLITPGKTLRKGTIVAARSVVTKNFDEYSVIGGNPAKLIKYRGEIQ